MSIRREQVGRTAVVTMQHGSVNAMDLELCDELIQTFDDLTQDDGVGAIVLTGDGRAFSAGVDLKQILTGGDEYTRQFVERLSQCFLATLTVPKPVVAAVNGHAIAGGCVLAAACDHVLAADGNARIGLSELQVGVPFPTSALEIVRARLGPSTGRAVFGASTYAPRAAAELGFVDEVVPADELMDAAHTVAERLGAVPSATYALAKRQLHAPLHAAVAAGAGVYDAQVADLWAGQEIRARMSAFLESARR